jgi:hypothetical protein
MKARFRFIAVFATTLALSTFAFSQSVKLQFKPTPGKKYTYVAQVKNQQSMPGSGGVTTNMSTTQQLTIQIAALGASAQGTRMKYNFLESKTTVPKDSPMAANIAQIDSMVKGSEFEATYDARGRMMGTPIAKSGNRMAQMLMTGMGAIGMGFLGVEYPAGAVAPGAQWTAQLDLQKMMSTMVPGMKAAGQAKTIPIVYRLARIERKGAMTLAHITYTMNGTTEFDMPSNAQQKGKISLSMNYSGTVAVDATTGMPQVATGGGTGSFTVGQIAMKQQTDAVFRLK